MPDYAQTNLELYAQLRRQAWSEADLARIRAAYRLATELFSSAYRPSGNTFLAHLIRTASIAAEHGAAPAVVVAGLLHAAYSHGEWGTSTRGLSRATRRRLGGEIGDAAEALVTAYTALAWGPDTVASFAAGPLEGREVPADVLLLRVANELEEHLDLAALHTSTADKRVRSVRRHAADWQRLAVGLGYPKLADELARVLEETAAGGDLGRAWHHDPVATSPQRVRFIHGPGSSYRLPPLSHSMRPCLALGRSLRRRVRALRQRLRR